MKTCPYLNTKGECIHKYYALGYKSAKILDDNFVISSGKSSLDFLGKIINDSEKVAGTNHNMKFHSNAVSTFNLLSLLILIAFFQNTFYCYICFIVNLYTNQKYVRIGMYFKYNSKRINSSRLPF